ncbi:hypothetical protein P3339_13815 [Microbulbifer sp. MLAF003]|uniref:dockerin type I repeat-containing protein n=1 Tax=Microbulbifer sp. MLAF003 TaxID=3032582 RepID=UPI0024AE2536|nr:dockerin type I domain-containing protein [Microbulbifer sp. MLAF003]WHI49546.1 hypothetical protein P3339_13815 [Microbulbifer sp. MLAF003]
MRTFTRNQVLGACLGLSLSATSIAQQSPFTGSASVNLGNNQNAVPQSIVSIPLQVNLSGVMAMDKDNLSIDAALGAIRVEIAYNSSQVVPIVESFTVPAGDSTEFARVHSAYVEGLQETKKLVITASQTAEATPTGLVNIANIPFVLLADSGEVTLEVTALDVISTLATTPDGIIGGETIPHTVTNGVITVTDATEEMSASAQTLMANSGDADNDGMPDAFELAHKLNPNSAADASLDSDGDGMSNLEEFARGTDPNYLHGDLNNDGTVDLVDIITVKRIAMGLEQASEDQLKAGHGDVNANGSIDLGDVIVIERLAMGAQKTNKK